MPKTPDDRFFADWMKRGIKPQNLPMNTMKHDKWDREDYVRLLKEMQELAASEDRITDVIETGGHLFEDTYFSLSKADPHLAGKGEVRPSHLINRAVMSEAMELAEWEELRQYSSGDEIGSALASIAMEPELETLWDRLQQEKKMAKQLRDQEKEADDREKTAEELMDELNNMDPNDPEYQQKQKDFNQNEDLLNQLREAMANGAEELQDALDKRGPSIRQSMRSVMNAGLDELADAEMAATSWGLERGTLQKLDPKERLELAKRLNNPRLKRICELIGPMSRMAFAEQMRKTTTARDEVYDIATGNDLGRVLPMELMSIRHPLRKYDFYRKYVEASLLQYELRGEERVAKGGIIVCEDGSGSMHGDREMWSKAVSLCLLHIARAQKRSFYGIHFGGPRELFIKDFRDPSNIDFEGVMEWAETFFGGGTDFMTPLTAALSCLQEEHKEFGAVHGDIVFITDGQCGVPPEWLENFKAEQARIGFRIFGVVIGGSVDSDPLKTICDGRVFSITDLKSGEDMRDIFRWV